MKPGGKRPGKIKEPDWFDSGKHKPKEKMKQLHWERWALPEDCEGTLWYKVHKELHTMMDFDQAKFEEMYKTSDKKKEPKDKVKKAKKIEMMDDKKFQNVSIMLTKQPKIPQMREALDTLDAKVFDRDTLEALKGGLPSDEEIDAFVSKIPEKEKSGTNWDPPELFWKLIVDYGKDIFQKRVEAWLFTLDWDEMMTNVRKPMQRLHGAVSCVTSSESLPYICGILLGFGNMMNYGHKQRGNAGAFSPKYLKDIEATKDQNGKLNLLQHLVREVKHRRPESMKVVEELVPIHNNIKAIKYDELQRGLDEAKNKLAKFTVQIKKVVASIEKQRGEAAAAQDPFGPSMDTFRSRADDELKELSGQYEQLKEDFMYLLKWWSSPPKVCEKPAPDEFFQNLVPFVEKFQQEGEELLKKEEAERKKKKKAGAKLAKAGGRGMTDLVDSIQEDLVT